MPNGQPDFVEKERPALERFFAPLADVLTDFGRRHNLRLTKYYHDAPSWSFTFKHPCGGVGKIEVERQNEARFRIACQWWYDDYDNLTRSLKRFIGDAHPRNADVLGQELAQALQQVVSWEFGRWDEKRGGYSWQSTWTKEQFQALQEQYPTIEGI